MDLTEKALDLIRGEWLAQGSPPVASVAKRANMPAITARRYLDGSTKHGDPAKVRALAIALGRSDIADSVKDTVSAELSDSIMKFMAEKFLLWRESNLEELERERCMREASEKRHAEEVERIITSKDKSIDMLRARVVQLEKDKEQLIADKAQINGEMQLIRSIKRRRDAFLIVALLVLLVMLMFIIIYLVKFDLPNPGYGVLR